MTTRERLRRALTGELPDRIPLCEICFWPETVERWKQEGLPADVDPLVWLDMDRFASCGLDSSLRLPTETLEEAEDRKDVRNSDGVLQRHWKDHTATPAPLDHLLKTADDWRTYRGRLEFVAERIPEGYADIWRASQEQGTFFVITPGEPIWWVMMTLGFERSFELMLEEPELIEEMVAAQADLSLALLDAAIAVGKPDALWYFSDLCYRNGMFFSPNLYRRLVLPHIQRVTAACHERGVLCMYHCCGDARPFIPLLIEGGFDCVQPLEARAGNDVRLLKPQYDGQITFFGNISVEKLSTTLEEAEEEVTSKVTVAAAGGRYIYHSDHSVPPTVPLANYRHALDLARKLGSYE